MQVRGVNYQLVRLDGIGWLSHRWLQAWSGSSVEARTGHFRCAEPPWRPAAPWSVARVEHISNQGRKRWYLRPTYLAIVKLEDERGLGAADGLLDNL